MSRRTAWASTSQFLSTEVPILDFADDPTPEEAARLFDASYTYVEVDTSALERVVAIGQTTERDGVRVEWIALELRAAGAVLYWRAHSERAAMLGSANIAVSNSTGTDFRTFASNGGGPMGRWSGQTRIIPAPHAGQRLVVEIIGFEGFDLGMPGAPSSPPIRGTWRLELDL